MLVARLRRRGLRRSGKLLLFYPERPEAQRAAAKFSRVWGAGDVALIIAACCSGTASARPISPRWHSRPRAGLPPAGHAAAALLVLAAALKTASFPLHGWLTEVMEAPTPVSALLHAGIINSGGVLLITTAGLVQQSPGAMAALVMLGGFTALFGALGDADAERGQDGARLVHRRADGLHAAAMRPGPLGAGAAAHRGALALQGACLPVLGERGQGRGRGPQARPVAVPGLAAVAKAFVLALVLYAAVAAGFIALAGPEVAAGAGAGRDPDLRCRLSGRPGSGRCRTPAR